MKAAGPDVLARAVSLRLQDRGMCILELAGVTGINRNVLGRWLSGTRSIRLDQAMLVAHELGLSVHVVAMVQVCRAQTRGVYSERA